MSYSDMQMALTQLIRLPDHNRDNIDLFLERFQLDPFERENIRSLALNREVKKFGLKMRMGRIVYLQESLPITCRLIDYGYLAKIVRVDFDPVETQTDIRHIYGAFRDFLNNHLPSQKILREIGPDYILDLINFELLDAEMEFTGLEEKVKLAKNSLLKHSQFRLLTLRYDIPTFMEKIKDIDSEKDINIFPELKETLLLFIEGKGECEKQRMFVIDEKLFKFLKTELNPILTPIKERKKYIPDCYDQLIGLGLCKSF